MHFTQGFCEKILWTPSPIIKKFQCLPMKGGGGVGLALLFTKLEILSLFYVWSQFEERQRKILDIDIATAPFPPGPGPLPKYTPFFV